MMKRAQPPPGLASWPVGSGRLHTPWFPGRLRLLKSLWFSLAHGVSDAGFVRLLSCAPCACGACASRGFGTQGSASLHPWATIRRRFVAQERRAAQDAVQAGQLKSRFHAAARLRCEPCCTANPTSRSLPSVPALARGRGCCIRPMARLKPPCSCRWERKAASRALRRRCSARSWARGLSSATPITFTYVLDMKQSPNSGDCTASSIGRAPS